MNESLASPETEILPFEISQGIKVSYPWQRVWSFSDSQLFPISVPKVLLIPSMNQIIVSDLTSKTYPLRA